MSIYNIQVTSQDTTHVTFTFQGTGIAGSGFTMYIAPWDGSTYGTRESQTVSFGASEANTSGTTISGLSLTAGNQYKLVNTSSGQSPDQASSAFTAASAEVSVRRTRLNDAQLAKLVTADKVAGGAIDITGSVSAVTSVADANNLLIDVSGAPKSVTAQIMADYIRSQAQPITGTIGYFNGNQYVKSYLQLRLSVCDSF